VSCTEVRARVGFAACAGVASLSFRSSSGLTLLRHTEPPVNGVRRVRKHGSVNTRIPSPTHSASLSVKKCEFHIVLKRYSGHFLLRRVLRPTCSQPPCVLGRVRVSDHDLLFPLDPPDVPRKREESIHLLRCVFEVGEGLEERDNSHGVSILRSHTKLFLEEHYRQNIYNEQSKSRKGLG